MLNLVKKPHEHSEPATATPLVCGANTPIIAGFQPDPTVCRVGLDYYLATSSFSLFPAIPIWHSTDLTTWRQIGNALDRPEQFAPGHAETNGGIYAPTLRFHNGRFWLITTDVSGPRGQLLIHAEHPAGPWSNPVYFTDLLGIDPDLAWDGDAAYVTWCSDLPDVPGIAQVRVDLAQARVLEAPRTIWQATTWRGNALAHPEAPHLYQRGDWWYLVLAEGGTERGHGVSVGRARSPQGPFEPAPNNPVFSHRSTTHPVQNAGHADLVELPDGSWAAVYLGVRLRGDTPGFHVNGRETFLAGIDWVDGWPQFVENRFWFEPPDHSLVAELPGNDAGLRLGAGSGSDPRWVHPGTEAAGVYLRTSDEYWGFEVEVDLTAGEIAVGLHMDRHHWYEVRADSDRAHVVVRIGQIEVPFGETAILSGRNQVTLRIETQAATFGGPDDVVFFLGHQELARLDGRYLSTEVAGGFVGRLVGLRSVSGSPQVHTVRYFTEPA